MTRHKYDIKTQSKGKVLSEYFSLPKHSIADLKMTVFLGGSGKWDCNSIIEQEIAELTYIKMFNAISRAQQVQ